MLEKKKRLARIFNFSGREDPGYAEYRRLSGTRQGAKKCVELYINLVNDETSILRQLATSTARRATR